MPCPIYVFISGNLAARSGCITKVSTILKFEMEPSGIGIGKITWLDLLLEDDSSGACESNCCISALSIYNVRYCFGKVYRSPFRVIEDSAISVKTFLPVDWALV